MQTCKFKMIGDSAWCEFETVDESDVMQYLKKTIFFDILAKMLKIRLRFSFFLLAFSLKGNERILTSKDFVKFEIYICKLTSSNFALVMFA